MLKKFKGVGLLILSNLLISITLYIVFQVLANVVLPAFGIDLRDSINGSIMVYALVLGFGGAFISLLFSKQMARAMLDCYQVTEPQTRQEEIVFRTVRELADRLRISMPEVWIYQAPDPNAFATGPTKNNAMVAVSTGLLENMNEAEVRSVLAHEMGHVWNGDMFTITVLMGLMNTFVYFIAMWVRRLFEERTRVHCLDCAADCAEHPRDARDQLVFQAARVRSGPVLSKGLWAVSNDLSAAKHQSLRGGGAGAKRLFRPARDHEDFRRHGRLDEPICHASAD